VDHFIEQANTFHPTRKFTAKMSENEITFMDTIQFKGKRFIENPMLNIKTQEYPTHRRGRGRGRGC